MKKYILALSIISFVSLHGAQMSHSEKTKKELWDGMAAEVDSWTDALGMPIDIQIRNLIIVLNLLGFKTRQSCEGHLEHGDASPWVDFDTKGNSEEELLRQEMATIKEKAEQKEKEVMKKYSYASLPEVYRNNDDPELNLLWEQYHQGRNKLNSLNKMKLLRLKELIDKFYKKHTADYDRMLILSSSDILENIGSDWQITRDENVRLLKLKEYQEEMQLFAKFLENYFWIDFDPSKKSS